MNRAVVLLCGLLAMTANAGAGVRQQPDWNPDPAGDDLVLPLPCGEAIAFRPVPVPQDSASPLADRRVVLGDAQAPEKFNEALRTDYVVGPFGSGRDAHYWLGKYEVTHGQYVAVMQGCTAFDQVLAPERSMPQAGVSWFQAVAFGEKATEFMLRTQPNALPGRDGAHAFVRLPTEAEWEYAARGAHPDEAAFRQELPPMDGPLTAYANLLRSGERPHVLPVGTLRADTLGLHDMLGNVSEIVLDPYRLTRGGRAGGEVGGVIARGGDARLPPDGIRTSLRAEHEPFNADGTPYTSDYLGFRVALGLQVITRAGIYNALQQAWNDEVQAEQQQLDPRLDPLALVTTLSKSADASERAALASIGDAIGLERSQHVQADERAARSAIGAGAALIREFSNSDKMRIGTQHQVEWAEQVFDANGRTAADGTRLLAVRHELDVWTLSRDTTFAILANLVLQQLDVPQPAIAGQLQVWLADNGGVQFARLRCWAQMFVDEIAAARPAHAVDHDAMWNRLLSDRCR